MEKQKQIRDKLLNILKKNVCCNGNECGRCDYDGDNCVEERLADTLIESGLIIPENAVVLTDDNAEELADMIVKSPKMQKTMSRLIKAWKKETEEKFAERLKSKFAYDIERCKAIDEICKEITNGKSENIITTDNE